jgi:hypothetical protein
MQSNEPPFSCHILPFRGARYQVPTSSRRTPSTTTVSLGGNKMKAALIIGTALMTLTALSHAEGLPEGNFKGDGLWKGHETSGKYTVSSELKGQTLISTYRMPDGSTSNWSFEMKAKENGFFDVISGAKVVGGGYCLDHVVLCHYEVKMGKLQLEETLTIQNEKLYKFGSKTENGFHVMWQEALGK